LSVVALLILALALAMDATAVAAAKGLASPAVRLSDALRVAVMFGGFQAGMTAAGAFAGARFAALIEAYDHWIAFSLLAGIGGKMIWEALRAGGHDDAVKPPSEPFAWKSLVIFAVATSIDALAAGVTLPLVDANVPLAVTLIGVTAGVLSFAGVYAGKKLGEQLGKRLDLAGGVVLVLLGVKTLVEHLRGG
jgi:putative Mn2+ efflux pump MntP